MVTHAHTHTHLHARATLSHRARPPDFDALSRYGWLWQPHYTVDENYMDLAGSSFVRLCSRLH